MEIEGTSGSKNLDETVCFQSEKKEYLIREIRGDKLQEIADGTSSAPHLASSSASRSPGETSVRGPYCSLIEQEEIEDSSCQRLR